MLELFLLLCNPILIVVLHSFLLLPYLLFKHYKRNTLLPIDVYSIFLYSILLSTL